MSTLVLDQAQVEELLTMPECIELMEETLVALAREELYQPLRSVVRPPGSDGGPRAWSASTSMRARVAEGAVGVAGIATPEAGRGSRS
jgi:ornithine cyclodeaminase/alanine dehydrogenase-like protein (mu-crystallin family)